jgi:4-alpha-glucanotransferase
MPQFCAADFASPYSPSSRRWLNIIYIDVGQVVDFQQSPASLSASRAWKCAQARRSAASLSAITAS